MARQLRALRSHSGSGLVLGTHVATTTIFNFSLSGSDALFWPLQATGTHLDHTYTCKPNTQKHKVKVKTVKTNLKKKGKGTLHKLIYIYIILYIHTCVCVSPF